MTRWKSLAEACAAASRFGTAFGQPDGGGWRAYARSWMRGEDVRRGVQRGHPIELEACRVAELA
jgi:hypothetical protein